MRYLIQLPLFLCLLFALGYGSAHGNAKDQLNLVANYWEPYTGEELPNQGIATEIVTTALRRAGYQPTVNIVPWERALELAYAGKVDGIVAIWSTKERRDKMVFSDAYLSNRMVLLHMRGKLCACKTLADLSGLHVGVGRGYDYSDQFSSARNFYLEPANRIMQNLRKLSAGRVDLVLEDERIAHYNLQIHGSEIPNVKDIEITPSALFDLPLYFGVSRHRPDADEIVSKFNAELKKMQGDGSLNVILKHFTW